MDAFTTSLNVSEAPVDSERDWWNNQWTYVCVVAQSEAPKDAERDWWNNQWTYVCTIA
jgi:hypothetical protein